MLFLASALLAQAPDSAPFTVRIPRFETQVEIDGVLDEPVWQQAARLSGFHQYQPVDSRPAEEETEVLVWYARNAIYFGVIAHDREPGAIRATRADRDNLDSEDRVTVYLDTFNDRRRAYFFTVNPLGIQADGIRTEGGFSAGNLVGGSIDPNPDFVWQSRGRVTERGYEVEIRIPFKSLRYPGSGPQAWGLNILRRTMRTGYEDAWTDTRRASASFLIQAGTIEGLHDLQSGLTTEIQPFVTAQATGARTATGFDRDAVDPSAGVNLRLGLSSNLSLDATYNPDFSQIESDVSQVTVNERFALFFPEKRPFFLEGIELFATPTQLVYTRQIVNPVAGGKFTAKLGRHNLAYLLAVDEAAGDDAWFNIARVRRDIGSNSNAGLTVTSREQDGGFNRVLAGDARIVFGKLYFVEGQLGGAWTRDSSGGRTRNGALWVLEFDRTGRSWGFNYKVSGVDESFEARSGFIPRNDFVEAHAFNRISFYGARGALFETLSLFGRTRRLWQYRDFLDGALEGNVAVEANLTVRGGWRLAGELEKSFVNFVPGSYANYTELVGNSQVPYAAPRGVDDAWSAGLSVTTPTFRAFNASLGVNRGRGAIFPEGAPGYETRITGSLSARPTGSLRLTASTTFSRITRDRDGQEFARTILPRAKLEYQASRSLFFRVVAEYVHTRRAALEAARSGNPLYVDGSPAGASESNNLRVDWLASFEPVPGTVAFAGYGATYQEPRALRFGGLERMNDGFFVKLAYQFRR